jgi:hypothetical protein
VNRGEHLNLEHRINVAVTRFLCEPVLECLVDKSVRQPRVVSGRGQLATRIPSVCGPQRLSRRSREFNTDVHGVGYLPQPVTQIPRRA